ncbi:HEAT repeat domain-containing protein [Kitasatospora sp. NPDC087314]|uniref:HEAT repeat domain-containing protein n=1 Tax=Kitasatospora sp. NPDC087314 TaxID=3364068 RepID=UPI00380E89EE
MLTALHTVDWSSLHHAYGPADDVPAMLLALRAPDADERAKALTLYYNQVFHQGTVDECTTATLPFLFELADGPGIPDRAAIVELLVAIGKAAVEHGDKEYCNADFIGAAAVVREHAERFVGFAADPDPLIRRAAIPGLGLFIDDARRASTLLRDRLPAEHGIAQRLLAVEAMATLALRLPEAAGTAEAWFTALATDPTQGAAIRLAAVIQQARCAPERIGEDTIATAIGLRRDLAQETPDPDDAWWVSTGPAPPPAPADGDVPPWIAAAFEQLGRNGHRHAPTTELLRTFHDVLDSWVAERSTLLAEQLRAPDPGSRLDALRMSRDLIKTWRGDHTQLVALVAEHLGAAHPEVAAEAATVLHDCGPATEPAREALANYVAAQRTTHGPHAWAAPKPLLRRAHQEAVQALARLGDARAVPDLLAALDSGVDDWRAVEAAQYLPQAADQLVPPLCERLRRVDLTERRGRASARPLLASLAALADQAAVPAVTETLAAAVRHERWGLMSEALEALAAFGPAAKPALADIRALAATTEHDADVRLAALAALRATGADPAEILPPLLDLLADGTRPTDIADLFAAIGPAAAGALPRLRELLGHDYEWVRVHCAAALWSIGGEPEAPAVLETLLQAWEQNQSTANLVVACLDRMGIAAEPALPLIREQLARRRRGGRFTSIDNDKELQRIGHAIIQRFV